MSFLLILIALLHFVRSVKVLATVKVEGEDKFSVSYGIDKENGAAWIEYDSTFFELGWDHFVLETRSDKRYTDLTLAQASGYLEGFITADRILDHYLNSNYFTWSGKNLTEMPEDVKEFFIQQSEYMQNLYRDDPTDPFNIQVMLTYLQMKGLVEGFNANSTQKVSMEELQVIISFGDILGIPSKHYPEKGKFHVADTHCSALFKITPDYEDIFFGHNSWYGYSMMSKMFKEYIFHFDTSAAKSIIMSSYPGTLASNDDYIVSSENIVVIETSLNLFNKKLFDLISPNTLMVWQREVIAMRMAKDSKQWCDVFSKHFSGEDLKVGTFYILEEIPQHLVVADQTDILGYGYWPSYNVPFYPEIYEVSGYKEYVKEHPEAKKKYDYDLCARAEIFRRDQTKVEDIHSFAKLMRYNDYKNDPYSYGDPSLSISSRYDLAETPRCVGAYDAKISSAKMFLNTQAFRVITGPTFEADYIDPFNWKTTNACDGMERTGMPDEMKYDWVDYKMQYNN